MHHIAREEDIGQSVVVDIPDSDAPAIIEINIIQHIQGFTFEKRILEIDAGLIFVQLGEEGSRILVGPTTGEP